MTRAEEINVLMADRCTRNEAEKYTQNGTTIYDDPGEWVTEFNRSDCGQAEIIDGQAYIDGKPAMDVNLVEYEDHTYLIEYVH